MKQSIDSDQNLAGRDSCFENPEERLIRNANSVLLRTALEVLPTPWRKILILRELQGMSYKEISTTVGAPVGTVMSRLSRARARLSQSVADLMIVRTEPRAEV